MRSEILSLLLLAVIWLWLDNFAQWKISGMMKLNGKLSGRRFMISLGEIVCCKVQKRRGWKGRKMNVESGAHSDDVKKAFLSVMEGKTSKRVLLKSIWTLSNMKRAKIYFEGPSNRWFSNFSQCYHISM